jgi:hypothetical protein
VLLNADLLPHLRTLQSPRSDSAMRLHWRTVGGFTVWSDSHFLSSSVPGRVRVADEIHGNSSDLSISSMQKGQLFRLALLL